MTQFVESMKDVVGVSGGAIGLCTALWMMLRRAARDQESLDKLPGFEQRITEAADRMDAMKATSEQTQLTLLEHIRVDEQRMDEVRDILKDINRQLGDVRERSSRVEGQVGTVVSMLEQRR